MQRRDSSSSLVLSNSRRAWQRYESKQDGCPHSLPHLLVRTVNSDRWARHPAVRLAPIDAPSLTFTTTAADAIVLKFLRLLSLYIPPQIGTTKWVETALAL